ncbi:phage-related protein [Acidovorax sp. MR-S7]|nr:phage-related protein [Acidovorax sp. MR-S7]
MFMVAHILDHWDMRTDRNLAAYLEGEFVILDHWDMRTDRNPKAVYV